VRRWVLAVVAIATIAPPAAATDCRPGLVAWPDAGSTIPVNGVIVVRGQDRSRLAVADIDARRPALACGKRVIPLRLEDLYAGHFDAEALLVPTHQLPPLTRCELVLTAPKHGAPNPLPWRRSDGEELDGPPWWTTSAHPDRQRPRWTAPPALAGEAKGSRPGYGPATCTLSIDAQDPEGPTIIRVLLDDATEKNDFLLVPLHGTIDIAQHGCGGAFEIEPGAHYRVTLFALDAAGNELRAPGPPVEIVVP
jgi:hypothetical protein